MVRIGISGRPLTIDSLLENSDKKELANNAFLKTSSSIKEAAKTGLQKLYADIDDIKEKYTEFDIIKEMQERKGGNFLWVRARAIDANVCNTNGDYFSEEELTKENDYQGRKMPAYKSFEGVPIFSNHKNDDIDQARGKVVWAEWDDEEKCVYCVFFIDEDAYPDVARGIRQGYITDVSMGAIVEYGICSICGNKATDTKDYCSCLKNYKGKQHPCGEKAFEYNYGIKFIELSCVGDGAFEACEILEIYDQDDILEKSKQTIKAAHSLNSSITLAYSLPHNKEEKNSLEPLLRQLYNLNKDIIKIAQAPGTLIGGQLGVQNATVVKILQGLGIDPSGQLNILDLVNLALNFLEVAVINLFSRKDNIDLGHVAKLTKAMGDLQNTLQDMIDDGIESGGIQKQPMIPPQNPQAPQNQPANNQQSMPAVNQLFEPSVGTILSPFTGEMSTMPLGGSVKSSTNARFVWASTQEEVNTKPLNKIEKLAHSLNELRIICNIPEKHYKEDLKITQKINNVTPGDKKIMDHFKKIAQDLKKQTAVALEIDIKLDDQRGNKVVLSTSQGIKGYHNGNLTNWKPELTETQIAQMENGDGYKVASDLLKDFSNLVKKAQAEFKIDHLMVLEDNLEKDHDKQEYDVHKDLDKDHKHEGLNQYNDLLNSHRKYDDHTENTYSTLLSEKNTNDFKRIVTELAEDAHMGLGHTQFEDMLHPSKENSSVSGREIMSNVITAIAKTCSKTKSTPEQVVTFLINAAQNEQFPKMLVLAKLGTKFRKYSSVYAQVLEPTDDLNQTPALPAPDSPESSSVKDIVDEADPSTTEQDILDALMVIKDNYQSAVDKLNEVLSKHEKDPTKEKMDAMKDSLNSDNPVDDNVDDEAMKGAVMGLGLSNDMGTPASDIVKSVNDMPVNQMVTNLNTARMPANSMARVKNRNIRNASAKNNVIEWLADVANEKNIPSDKIALAAKYLCSHDVAETIIKKAASKFAEVRVTDESSHITTIHATLDDLDADVKDAAFNDKFKEYAIQLLSQSGYEVDPSTFALTEINVDENGMVCGKVISRSMKSFIPDEIIDEEETPYVDPDLAEKSINQEKPSIETSSPEPQVVMSPEAQRLSRIQNVIKIAQGLGLPGAPNTGANAPANAASLGTDPLAQSAPGMAGGAADLGLSSLTGSSTPSETPVNDSPEPGNISPWGTICPHCGSKNLDIANGEGTCNSCNSQLHFEFSVRTTPPDKNRGDDMGANAESPMPPTTEAPAPATQGAAFPAPVPGGGAPQLTGMPNAAFTRNVMTKVAYTISSEIYAESLRDNFDKTKAKVLPVGMICPSCGSRTASVQGKKTFCYDCNTMSIHSIKESSVKPGFLEVTSTWL